MTAKTSSIHIQLKPGVRERAEEVLASLGMPLSNAINLFLEQIVVKQRLPFDLSPKGSHRIELGRMSADELDHLLKDSYTSYLHNEGRPAKDVFAEIEKDYGI